MPVIFYKAISRERSLIQAYQDLFGIGTAVKNRTSGIATASFKVSSYKDRYVSRQRSYGSLYIEPLIRVN